MTSYAVGFVEDDELRDRLDRVEERQMAGDFWRAVRFAWWAILLAAAGFAFVVWRLATVG